VGCRKRTAGGGGGSCADVGNDATARGGGRRIAHLRTCTRRCEQPGVQPQSSTGNSAVKLRRMRALRRAAGYERTETHPGNKMKAYLGGGVGCEGVHIGAVFDGAAAQGDQRRRLKSHLHDATADGVQDRFIRRPKAEV